MVAHVDYIKGQDISQLKHLIKVSEERIKEIESKGQVRIFGVFKGSSNFAWFGMRDQAEAAFIKAAAEVAGEKYPEVSIDPQMVPVEELADYLGEKAASDFLAAEPKIHPLPFK